ncbi:nuclear transport factor 2 family protein [Sphingobium subterraneum]|uniref:SnoaL-like domain-containing protein n=1 Tax=Sphingobium subterraneum TaxID=627688 RepID=A0A841J9T2_9SPHN|nr:nuclear transport factor 2 family protein [Sphingobium subterraneum]MBB6125318.1 hypothetical protein [Sphingobium subterraneum]
MDALFRLTAIEDIRVLKARYCRFVDNKDWAAFRALFADDATLFFPENYNEPASINDFMPGVDVALAGSVTVHHIFAPEIEILSEVSARGLWAMEDALYFPPDAEGFAGASEIHGSGHYHETYVRQGDRWLFQSIRLSRLRLDVRAKPRAVG